jgi:hypothetical protein
VTPLCAAYGTLTRAWVREMRKVRNELRQARRWQVTDHPQTTTQIRRDRIVGCCDLAWVYYARAAALYEQARAVREAIDIRRAHEMLLAALAREAERG